MLKSLRIALDTKVTLLEDKTLANPYQHVLRYKLLRESQPIRWKRTLNLGVGVWFTTPIARLHDVQWDEWDPMEDIREMFEDISKPKLTVIKGGKDDDKSN